MNVKKIIITNILEKITKWNSNSVAQKALHTPLTIKLHRVYTCILQNRNYDNDNSK